VEMETSCTCLPRWSSSVISIRLFVLRPTAWLDVASWTIRCRRLPFVCWHHPVIVGDRPRFEPVLRSSVSDARAPTMTNITFLAMT